jgi:serine/threonine protein kinase
MTSKNSTLIALGTILDGKFRVNREIGRGGMAAVYEAENVDIGKRVAVKVLAAELANSKVVTERFMREARAAAKIRSLNICDVYDVGTYNGRPFLVMELLEGESLYDRLARERRLKIDEVISIATETATGLQQAHDVSIVHRDLKPENIFLSRTGTGEQVAKIVDFGLAKFYEPHLEGGAAARLTKDGALFGTPAYMSPEQARAQGGIDHRSDLWALGCIVYEMLVGRTVWNVEQGVAMILAQIAGGPLPRPTKVRADIPEAFDLWFAKALDRDPAGRYTSAAEMAAELKKALLEPPRVAPSPRLPTSDVEANAVHALVNKPPLMPPPPLKPIISPSARPLASGIPSGMPPQLRRRRVRLLPLMFGAIALSMVGLVAWAVVKSPRQILDRIKWLSPDKPLEEGAYAALIADGQKALVDGNSSTALSTFEQAFQDGEKKAARSLRSHAQAAFEQPSDTGCQVRGLGHPRPFDLSTKSSRPTLIASGRDFVSAWVAQHGEKQRPVFAVRLDFALRRVGTMQVVTPEATEAHDPQLFPAEGGLGLLYSDAGGENPGIYGRLLDDEGNVKAAPRLLSVAEGALAYDPNVASAGDGNYWLVYSQVTDPKAKVHDLFVRHLGKDLSPLADPVRVTAYAQPKKGRTAAAQASIDVLQGQLNIVYRLRRGNDGQVVQLRVTPQELQQKQGGVQRVSNRPVSAGDEESDRFVGQTVTLSENIGQYSYPRVTCFDGGCLSVWSEEKGGAYAAWLANDTEEVLWRRNFAAGGSRPSLGRSGSRAVIVWYEGNRVQLASIDKNGLGKPTVVGRAGGLQPHPEVVAGAEPGQWYISWRDYEAAVFEPFVARVDCK